MDLAMLVKSNQAQTIYRQYMESDNWKALRQKAIKRANKCCEFCGRQGDSIHHVRYPKVFLEDVLDNLVVVCRTCHELSHGIRRSKDHDLTGIMQCALNAYGRAFCERCKGSIVQENENLEHD